VEEEHRASKLRMNLIPAARAADGATSRAAGAAHGSARGRTTRIAVVGLPNSGKSQLCNSLTGSYELVSNYPLTTVEIKTHHIAVEGGRWEVADTPGLHGLFIQSEEELVVRENLFAEPPDIMVQCIDAQRFKESLLLTADLLGMGIPLVLVVVGVDAANGIRVDAAKLGVLLGVPVVCSPAPGKGIAELIGVLRSAARPQPPLRYGGALETAIETVRGLLPDGFACPRQSAVLLLENDPTFLDYLAATRGVEARRVLESEVEKIRAGLAGRFPLMVSARKGRWVDDVTAMVAATVPGPRGTRTASGPSGYSRTRVHRGIRFSETFARLCRHPVYGLPILAFFLGIIYLMVVYVAGALSLALTLAVTDPVVREVSRLIPAGFWRDLLVGSHGLLTLGLFNSLTTVLPILSVFFMVFGLLEDIGYLPNLAILTRRVSAKVGITGNAVIPLVLGFGCKTMATMTARHLPRREKIIVIAMIAFAIPCSAQMGLSIAILGAHGIRYFLVAFAFLGVAELAAGLLMNRFMKEDSHSQYIQELPPIRVPRISAVAKKTGYRLLWFLREAIPIFLIAALAMFVIDRVGLLALLKEALAPFMTRILGLPVDMVDALLLTLARSEAAAGYVLKMSREGTLNGAQAVVAVVLLTTFAQCFANIAAIFRELGARVALIIVISIYLLSFLYTGAVHEVMVLAQGVMR
jgi:ferrous iron transport protein B